MAHTLKVKFFKEELVGKDPNLKYVPTLLQFPLALVKLLLLYRVWGCQNCNIPVINGYFKNSALRYQPWPSFEQKCFKGYTVRKIEGIPVL